MDYRQLRLNQNSWIQASPGPRGLALYTGSYADAPNGTIMFLNANGDAIESIPCGESFQFLVKGYTSVWLTQTRDGQPQYDGLIGVPVTYESGCWNDPGAYHGEVFDSLKNPIGVYDFTIEGSALWGLSPVMIGAAVLVFFLLRKRR